MKGGVYDDLLAGLRRQTEDEGLRLKEAEAAIIDATLVERAARPRRMIKRTRAPYDATQPQHREDQIDEHMHQTSCGKARHRDQTNSPASLLSAHFTKQVYAR